MEVSVIIPTYKPNSYIVDCIESLKNQSFSSDLYEVIIVLNGEREPYFAYVESLISEMKNFNLYYTEQKGVSNARNFGINMSKGSFLAFIDDDDEVSSNYLSVLFNEGKVINKFDCIIQSNVIAIKENVIYEDYISKAYLKLKNKEYNILTHRKFLSNVNGKMYSRKVIGNIRFDTRLSVSEDALFLFELSVNLGRIKLVENEECIYYRKVRGNSLTTTKKSSKEYSLLFFTKLSLFTKVYLGNISKYNFIFYLTRVLAIVKVYFYELRRNM
ncbi:glycosyltransferase family 2 protein [Myroides odoratimimus]|uniref:glycosyltransferase family 2 protein n=1 Tax=Myroides odoratimimus TaxID=76832 RepID=UPI0025788E7F|nr:glycosyltransferase family 2 protein [Myroides odoratimimus]MDM1096708.1 glycosyltransferase family 2 protein [Myroides odoratimimus]